jgi:FkbM family methyltransferase
MKLTEKFGMLYYLLPYLKVIDNKIGLILSIFLGKNNYLIKLKDNKINFKSSEISFLINFLGLIRYCSSYEIISNQKIIFTIDLKNSFAIPLKNMSNEDKKLIETLYYGLKFGGNFETNNSTLKSIRDKTLSITTKNNKKIIETSSGIKFYIDSINPGNTIAEAFIMDVHNISSSDDYNNKIVVDIGAECGDTPLYYANKGATVFAFEPIKANFDAMLRNLSLNPELSKKITPINAGIGKDEELKFFHSAREDIADSSSFVYNAHDNDVILENVQGYTLSSAMKKFNIPHIDFLKTDCKGCEFFLKEDDLVKVDKVKIEYESFTYTKHKLSELTKVLDNSNFEYILYRLEPSRDNYSITEFGHLYGEKRK